MMQAYTEEQRKALIEFTKQRIEALRFSIKQHAFESIRKPLQSELAVAEIAMAALTARPVGTIRIEMDWNTHRNVATLDMRDDLVAADMRTGDKLYTAPPVAAPAVPDGWKLVPVEPTAAMYDAGDHQLATKQVWDAMLAAAPEVE